MSTISENIKNFRTFRGIKQQELADRLGKSKSVISNWERGENSPDVESCAQLCKILDVTPNELFGWEMNLEYDRWLEDQAEIIIEMNKIADEKIALDARFEEYQKRLRELNKNVRRGELDN